MLPDIRHTIFLFRVQASALLLQELACKRLKNIWFVGVVRV
jgi:hypothetical protein